MILEQESKTKQIPASKLPMLGKKTWISTELCFSKAYLHDNRGFPTECLLQNAKKEYPEQNLQ